MKNSYFYLKTESEHEELERIAKYHISFNDTIEIFLEEVASKYKVDRPPIIYYLLRNYISYLNELFDESSEYESKEQDINLIEEIKRWYNDFGKIGGTVDSHISKENKADIIRELFLHLTLTRVKCIKKYQLNHTIESLGILKTAHSDTVIDEVNQIIENSHNNTEFFKKLGIDILAIH